MPRRKLIVLGAAVGAALGTFLRSRKRRPMPIGPRYVIYYGNRAVYLERDAVTGGLTGTACDTNYFPNSTLH